MVSSGALLIAAAAVVFLVLSACWAEYRFRLFQKLPAHFNASGRATSLAARSFVIWLTPTIFISLIALILVLLQTLPADHIKGDPDSAVYLMSIIIVGTQGLILWLLVRCARASLIRNHCGFAKLLVRMRQKQTAQPDRRDCFCGHAWGLGHVRWRKPRCG